MKTKTNKIVTLLASAAVLICGNAKGQLYSDAFTTDTSAAWTIRAASVTAVDDYTAQFAFYYATNKFVRGGVTNTIPLAPNSTIGVATNGLKLTVNKNDATPDASGINLYPNLGSTFSNDFALKFDMWVNYNGGEFGGSGSTEFAIWGVNMDGLHTNWAAGGSVEQGDGVWYGVTGEGGAARDWRSYVGDAVIPGLPLELQGISGGFFDRDFDAVPEQEVFTEPDYAPLRLMFPRPTYETAGVPGKQWVQVEVRQRTNDVGGNWVNTVTWLMNGQIIATNTYDAFLQTNGNVMIGTMDPFASIASPAADNFIIFDNVRVVDLSGAPVPQTVAIVATAPTGMEGSTNGQMVVTRSGSTASALTVPINVSSFAGAATRNSDFFIRTNGVNMTNANSIIIPAGSATATVDIIVINDNIGESTEKAIITLAGNPSAYDLGLSNYAIVDISDDGDLPTATVTTFRRAAYEGNTNSYGQFRIDFSNPFTASDVTVNYLITGTAANGTHYTTIASSVVMTNNTTNVFVTILPIDNADTVSNRTVILTLTNGVNYLVSTNGTTNGTVTIFNDDLVAPVATAFSDNFDVDSSAGWNVNFGTTPTRDRATFAYDYSADGIPSAPKSIGGTTKALKMEANVITLGTALFSGLSASPIGGNFTGDYRLRFDWWGNFGGPFPASGTGTTQMGTYGITRGGAFSQWPGSGSPASKDSVYFAVTVDGGSGTDYRAYTNGGTTLPAATSLTANAVDNLNSYYGVFGNLAAPPAQLLTPFGAAQTGRTALGAPGEVWHDVVITKLGSTVLWHMDGVLLATVNATKLDYVLSTNIFVGHSDINGGQATVPEMLFSLYDNLVVETLPAPAVNITSIVTPSTTRVITFTGGTADPAAAYVLQQAPVVTGPYTNNLSATITNNSPGAFTAITTNTAGTQFYRIRR